MSKLTSVEWFYNELIEHKIIKKEKHFSFVKNFATTYELLLEQAKEMHKEEILGAYQTGRFNYEDWDKGIKKTLIQSEDYYKQHYTNEMIDVPQQNDVMEDDIEKLADEYYKSNGMDYGSVEAFIAGYKKAKENTYTEQQMKLAFEYGKSLEPFDSFEDFIQSFKQHKQ